MADNTRTDAETPAAPKADATPAGSGGKPPGVKRAVEEGKAKAKASGADKAAKPKRARTARKTKVTSPNTDTPEAKRGTKAKAAAAEKLFEDAASAARHGLPPDMTKDQYENHVRRAATGY